MPVDGQVLLAGTRIVGVYTSGVPVYAGPTSYLDCYQFGKYIRLQTGWTLFSYP